MGIVVLTVAAIGAHSLALAGFRLNSWIEIGANTVVPWDLSGTGETVTAEPCRLIAAAFLALAAHHPQSVTLLGTSYHPRHRPRGIAWTVITAEVMFALAVRKARTSRLIAKPALITERRVTTIDGLLAVLIHKATRGCCEQTLPKARLSPYALRGAREILTTNA